MTDVRALVESLGADPSDIDAAEANGTLLALAAERFLLPGERKFTSAEVAALAGMPHDDWTRLQLALGFAARAPDDKTFGEGDLEVVRTLLADGTTISDYTIHMARVISASLARIAEVFIDELWDQHFSAGQSQTEALGEMAEGVDIERMEALLMYMHRRQLVAAIYRRSALHDRATREGQPTLAIGFADIAGYTSLSQAMDAAALTRLVVAFERRTYDLIAEMGGRIVKSIGDEVLFAFDEPTVAATFALELCAFPGEDVPALRIGLGWGPVLTRQGDCFGPTVNLASRVVGVAQAGEVLLEESIAHALRDAGFNVVSLGRKGLKSFGDVELSRLSSGP